MIDNLEAQLQLIQGNFARRVDIEGSEEHLHGYESEASV
jgi:hypothetical protein